MARSGSGADRRTLETLSRVPTLKASQPHRPLHSRVPYFSDSDSSGESEPPLNNAPQAIEIDREIGDQGDEEGRSGESEGPNQIAGPFVSMFQFFKDFNPFPTGHEDYLSGDDYDFEGGETDSGGEDDSSGEEGGSHDSEDQDYYDEAAFLPHLAPDFPKTDGSQWAAQTPVPIDIDKEEALATSRRSEPLVPDVFSLVRHGRLLEVESVLQRGISPDMADHRGNTLLMIACQNNHKRMCKLIMRSGADLDLQNRAGNTALHYCFVYKYKKIAEYLTIKGANTTLRNADGLTCYQV